MPRTSPDLSLYHFDSCPYCARVRHAIASLDLQIEYRDIHKDEKHLDALVAARGRQTVPVLRIAGPNGDTWMPESADIIAYLRERFAKA
jgi:glutaredoxin 2